MIYVETLNQKYIWRVINIKYKDGSIHYFIEIAGVLFTGIAAYGAIRSFIDYSIKDSKNLRNIIKNK